MDLFGRGTISVNADARVVAVDGERPWLDGGYGKARFGGNGGWTLRPELAEGTIAWQPHFGWALSGTVVAVAQNGQDNALDLSEAFLNIKPMASGPVKFSARAGLFWPPVSLEHSGADWHVTETITPSAINSWIGEEVKVIGPEATLSFPIGASQLSATGALFEYNDTAGTLIAFRGWALHDEKAVAFGKQPLPPQNGFITAVQSPYTRPVIELDHKIGYYAKLGWSPPLPLHVDLLYYDNRGDPRAVNVSKEWGWRTRFVSLGLLARPLPMLDIRAQAMQGRTKMGYPRGGVIWIDTRFRSAYVMATRHIGMGSVSARAEVFDTRNSGSMLTGADQEHGWAATLAARRPIGRHAALLIEAEHIDSHRPARLRLNGAAQATQTQLQLALRVHF